MKIEFSERDSERLRAVLRHSEPHRETLALRRTHARAFLALLLVVLGCIAMLATSLLQG